jgi:uncharacterized protein
MPIIVPFYAAVLGVIFVVLSARVIVARRQFKVRLGFAGHELLERRIRVQGNFSEYVPITIVLLAFLELYGGPRWLIHVLCIALILARLLHAYCVGRTDEDIRHRRIAMGTTLAVLLIAAAGVLGYAGARLFG